MITTEILSSLRPPKNQSSQIRAVGYDDNAKTMFVEFNNRTIYQYFNVSKKIYENLLNAPSAGTFLNSEIRDKYNYEKLS